MSYCEMLSNLLALLFLFKSATTFLLFAFTYQQNLFSGAVANLYFLYNYHSGLHIKFQTLQI